MEPENDPPAKMGDLSTEVTEENREASGLLKAKAMDAIFEGELNDAIDHLTAAIMLNPVSILYASRASVFIKLKKPKVAIRDVDAALQINPDLARGYKARGTARAMMWIRLIIWIRLMKTYVDGFRQERGAHENDMDMA